jgi:hypothetical protein
VVVRDDNVLDGWTIDQAIVRIMLDAGLVALTDAATPAEAWLGLLPDLAQDFSTGVKINTINSLLSSHPPVAQAIADSLSAVEVGGSNYPINQIVIWDRWEWELQAAGYEINTSTSGLRCFGTDHEGIGYVALDLDVAGTTQHASLAFTDYSDGLINLCVLKNHNVSGVTHSLKNHLGTIDIPELLHPDDGDPYIPALFSALNAEYGSRQKLCVCDAIFGIRYGGPMGAPQFAYKGLVLATDPVALDAVCRDILAENGCNTISLAHYIDTASQAPYSLGNSSLENIERIDINDPSVGVAPAAKSSLPNGMSLGPNYPEPFNAATTIPIELAHPANVHLDVYNARGARIRNLMTDWLPAGRHELRWDGLTENSAPAASGRYVVRLSDARKTHSRAITLLR